MKLFKLTYQVASGTVLRILINDVVINAAMAKQPVEFVRVKRSIMYGIEYYLYAGTLTPFTSHLAHRVYLEKTGKEKRYNVNPNRINWI